MNLARFRQNDDIYLVIQSSAVRFKVLYYTAYNNIYNLGWFQSLTLESLETKFAFVFSMIIWSIAFLLEVRLPA